MELTLEQQKVVNFAGDLLIVKGTAGSGKSLVGLHRANKMVGEVKGTLDFGNKEKRKVLFLTYTNSLVYELRRRYCSFFNSDEGIEFSTIDKIMQNVLTSDEEINKKYDVETFDGRFFKQNIGFIEGEIKGSRFDLEFVADEFAFIRDNMLGRDEYYKIVRKGRDLLLNEKDREFIFNLLVKYRNRLKNMGKIERKDAFIYLLKKGFVTEYDYPNIIVDEAQDLTKIKLQFLLKIKENATLTKKLTLLYDTSQTIFKNSCLGNAPSFISLGLNARGRVKNLSFSYRSTRQIHQCAYNMLKKYEIKDKNDEIKITPVFGQTDEGPKPVLINVENDGEAKSLYLDMVKQLLGKYKPEDIITIVPNGRDGARYCDYLMENGIKSYMMIPDLMKYLGLSEDEKNRCRRASMDKIALDMSETIKTYNPYNVKGLEGKVVFMLDSHELPYKCEKKDEEDIAKILYMEMTRSMELLFMFSIGKPNSFIESIEDKYVHKLEYSEDLDIERVLKSDIENSHEIITNNNVERFTTIMKDIEKEKAAIEKKEKELIAKEKKLEKLFPSSKELKKAEIENTKKKFPRLPEEIIKLLGEGCYYFNEDVEVSCSKFTKAIELVIREAFVSKKKTFGTMVMDMKKDKDLKPFAQEIEKLKIIKVRNEAAHNFMQDVEKLKVIYNYIYQDRRLEALHDKISYLKYLEDNESVMKKIAVVTSKGCTMTINRKDLYTFLLDDEEYGAHKHKIKDGTYILEGKYSTSRNNRIFIIENYKQYVV